MFDQPAMAAGKTFFALSDWAVSPDNKLVAWAEDTVGRRQYVIRIKDLASGAESCRHDRECRAQPGLGRRQPHAHLRRQGSGDAAGLQGDGAHARHPGDLRPDPLRREGRHLPDGHRPHDRRPLHLRVASKARPATSSAAARPPLPAHFTVVAPREREFRYNADHLGNRWIIRTNRGAKNYKLVTLADADMSKGEAAWRDLVPASDDVFIEAFKPFEAFVAIDQRDRRQSRHPPSRPTTASRSRSRPNEPAFRMALDVNEEPATPWVRYTYGSLVTPTTTYEVNARTGERRVLKVAPVPGYDPANYVTERLWAPARDGTQDSGVGGLPQGHQARRHRAAVSICLWQLRASRPIPRSIRAGSACSTAA